MRQLTYGCDPEFFLAGPNNQPLPVCGWLGGSKETHIPLFDCEVHEDGCAAELTFTRPDTDFNTMISRAQVGVSTVIDFVQTERGKNLRLYSSPYALFPHKVLDELGPIATTFGCSPEYDSYRHGISCDPVNSSMFATKEGYYRFAGGHIHLGYKELHPDVPEYVVAMLCDATIGLSLVAMGERQGERRKMYGSPGRFRPTAYGVEYRVPSNMWLYNGDVSAGLSTGCSRLQEILQSSEPAIRAKWNSIDWIAVRKALASESSVVASQLSGNL
jgi:hypothetical protein